MSISGEHRVPSAHSCMKWTNQDVIHCLSMHSVLLLTWQLIRLIWWRIQKVVMTCRSCGQPIVTTQDTAINEKTMARTLSTIWDQDGMNWPHVLYCRDFILSQNVNCTFLVIRHHQRFHAHSYHATYQNSSWHNVLIVKTSSASSKKSLFRCIHGMYCDSWISRHRHASDHLCPKKDQSDTDKQEKSDQIRKFVKDKLGQPDVIETKAPDKKKKMNPKVELMKMRHKALVSHSLWNWLDGITAHWWNKGDNGIPVDKRVYLKVHYPIETKKDSQAMFFLQVCFHSYLWVVHFDNAHTRMPMPTRIGWLAEYWIELQNRPRFPIITTKAMQKR